MEMNGSSSGTSAFQAICQSSGFPAASIDTMYTQRGFHMPSVRSGPLQLPLMCDTTIRKHHWWQAMAAASWSPGPACGPTLRELDPETTHVTSTPTEHSAMLLP